MNHSDQLDQIAAALAAFQGEVRAIPKGDTNPFFKSKYAGLPDVVATASPLATKHGLAVVQSMGFDGVHDTLTTMVLHTSGQWIADTMRLHLTKEDSQGHGSATTYARRYGYMSILGLVADDDDDGNAASNRQTAPAQQNNRPGTSGRRPPPSTTSTASGVLTAEQVAEMRAAVSAGKPF